MDEGLNSSEGCNGGRILQRIPNTNRAEAKGAPWTCMLSVASYKHTSVANSKVLIIKTQRTLEYNLLPLKEIVWEISLFTFWRILTQFSGLYEYEAG